MDNKQKRKFLTNSNDLVLNKKIKLDNLYLKNNFDNNSEDETEDETEDEDESENNNDDNFNKCFIIQPINTEYIEIISQLENDNSGSDSDSDYENENNNNNNINKNNQIKLENIEYPDSSDSENELDISNSEIFAVNLLKKTIRHNSKNNLKPNSIASKFNNKIIKMDKKYIECKKTPNKFKQLRQFKKNLDECKNIYNILTDDIKFYGSRFNFDLFLKKINIPNKQNDENEANLFDIILNNLNNEQSISKSTTNTKLDDEFKELYDKNDNLKQSGFKYFKTLNKKLKLEYINKLKQINTQNDLTDKRPNYMKILDIETECSNKSLILQRIQQLENKNHDIKLKNWVNKIMNVPFGIYKKPSVDKTYPVSKIKEYLERVRKLLDKEIFGHQTTKEQLIKILAHTITNPKEGGNIFALQGPPGVGKTALIQDGIAKALDKPFAFISLGGATDASFLEGHDFTYEGSNHGRIIEVLQQSKCMNPVIYFDELDKVSETPKGDEIINILMHLTDQTQNSHFNDKYFGGINFDLSKAIIIFSFNDEQKISRILKDRMKIIKVKGYKITEKITIAKDYLIPKLLKNIGLDDIQINISDTMLEYLIDSYTYEGGVRKLKELLNDIFLEINLRKLEENKIMNKKITKSPIVLTEEMIEKDFLKKKHKITHLKINPDPLIGIVNGLWASDYGVGGLTPIECYWVPSINKLDLILTGMQGDVMKESMNVAKTVAWRILPDYIKEKLNEKWKKSFDYGIHIHCPDGSTPKDGPSAGGAITTCLISLLSNIKANNKIAMTGEINLKGHITAIGGLEEKIFGALKAGVELVLCPKENLKDLDEIIEKFPNIFNEKFKVKTIDTIWDILNEVIEEKIDWIKFD